MSASAVGAVHDDPFSGAGDDLLGELPRVFEGFLGDDAPGDVDGEAADDLRLARFRPDRISVLPVAPLPRARLYDHHAGGRPLVPDAPEVAGKSGSTFGGQDVRDRPLSGPEIVLRVLERAGGIPVHGQDFPLEIVGAEKNLPVLDELMMQGLRGPQRILRALPLCNVRGHPSHERGARGVAEGEFEDAPMMNAIRSGQDFLELRRAPRAKNGFVVRARLCGHLRREPLVVRLAPNLLEREAEDGLKHPVDVDHASPVVSQERHGRAVVDEGMDAGIREIQVACGALPPTAGAGEPDLPIDGGREPGEHAVGKKVVGAASHRGASDAFAEGRGDHDDRELRPRSLDTPQAGGSVRIRRPVVADGNVPER